jgi:hypothetical protein
VLHFAVCTTPMAPSRPPPHPNAQHEQGQRRLGSLKLPRRWRRLRGQERPRGQPHIIAGSPDRQRCQSVQPAAPRKTSLPANANLQRAAFCVRHRLGNGRRPVANGRQRRTSGAKAPSAECSTQLLGAPMLDHAPRGLTNHEIAEKLGLKLGTIKHYMTKVFRKMRLPIACKRSSPRKLFLMSMASARCRTRASTQLTT